MSNEKSNRMLKQIHERLNATADMIAARIIQTATQRAEQIAAGDVDVIETIDFNEARARAVAKKPKTKLKTKTSPSGHKYKVHLPGPHRKTLCGKQKLKDATTASREGFLSVSGHCGRCALIAGLEK